MFEGSKEIGVIKAEDVRAGDVLLCLLKPEPKSEYVKLTLELIIDLTKGLWDKRTIDLRKYNALIDFAIALFDQNKYYHAAYCGDTKYWRGKFGEKATTKYSACVVEENLDKGILALPIEDYDDENYPTVVLRYRNKEGQTVGSDGLPSRPLDESARKIYDAIIGKPYGFGNAAVLVALCINRMSQGPLIREFEHRLIDYWGPESAEEIRRIFKLFGPKIGEWMDKISRDILRGAWDEKKMVCSQFVAAAYNQALPQNAYFVEKPSHVKMVEAAVASAPVGSEQASAELGNGILDQALQDLPSPSLCTELRSFEDIAAVMKIDDMYTPADFVGSPNMEMMGKLVFR